MQKGEFDGSELMDRPFEIPVSRVMPVMLEASFSWWAGTATALCCWDWEGSRTQLALL